MKKRGKNDLPLPGQKWPLATGNDPKCSKMTPATGNDPFVTGNDRSSGWQGEHYRTPPSSRKWCFLFFLYFLQRQAVRNDRVVGIALDRLKKIFLSLKKKNLNFVLTLESIPCKFQQNPSKKVVAAYNGLIASSLDVNIERKCTNSYENILELILTINDTKLNVIQTKS